MGEKRVTQQIASDEIYNDDWFLKDSVLHDTTKVQPSVIKEYVNQGMATSQDLADEATARTNADTALGGRIDDEATARQQADTALGQRIDDLNFSANAISYDNETSGLEADNIQDAIDEVLETAGKVDDIVSHGQSLVTNKISDLSSLTAVGTASGDIATFNDGSDLPMPKLEVAIEPVQDLHGYDAPWVGGAGKNKLPLSFTDGSSVNGITIYKNADGTVKITGKATSQAVITIGEYTTPTNQSIKYSGSVGGSASTYSINIEINGGYNYTDIYDGDSSAVSVSANDVIREVIVVRSGYECPTSGIIFYPMIRNSSESFTFAPYSNICPILGWDEVNATRCGKNLVFKKFANASITNTGVILPSNFDMWVAKVKKGLTYTITSNELFVGGFFTEEPVLNSITYNNQRIADGPKTVVAPIDGYVAFRSETGYSTAQLEIGSQSTDYIPYNPDSTTYTIDLDGTRYGGTLDVVSGLLTVYPNRCNLGDLNWVYASTQKVFYCNLPTDALNVTNKNGLCEGYKPTSWETMDSSTWSHLSNGEFVFSGNLMTSGRCALVIKDLNYTDATTFKSAVNGIYILYPLATPQTYQLTPTQVNSLLNQNNVWADTGDIVEAKYCRDLTTVLANMSSYSETVLYSTNSDTPSNVTLTDDFTNYDAIVMDFIRSADSRNYHCLITYFTNLLAVGNSIQAVVSTNYISFDITNSKLFTMINQSGLYVKKVIGIKY